MLVVNQVHTEPTSVGVFYGPGGPSAKFVRAAQRQKMMAASRTMTAVAESIPDGAIPPVLLLPAALLAATLATLLAYHQPPSATLLNQCLAVALWGAVAALLAPARLHGSTGPLLAAGGVMGSGLAFCLALSGCPRWRCTSTARCRVQRRWLKG